MTTLQISKNNNKIAILFDLDGTLINSLPDICGALNQVRAGYGLRAREGEEIRVWIGKGAGHLIEGGIPEIPAEVRPEAVKHYKDALLERPSFGGSLYPGVRSVLELFQAAGVRLAVATNKSSKAAEASLAYYLPGFSFDSISGPERVSRQKPSPEHLLEPLKKLGIKPSAAWFVGDDPVDKACAEAAGVRFLAAGYGFGGVKAPKEQCLKTFTDLLKKIPLPSVGF